MNQHTPVIGIPRALLYYRCGTLWKTWFETLDIPVVLSPPTGREILENGTALAVDETCLSMKLFMGHVQALLGQCDRIFIPRYSNYGRGKLFCTRFEGVYDQTRNVFRAERDRFISCNIDEMNGFTEEKAFITLGEKLGFSEKESRSAYAAAVRADAKERKHLEKEMQEDWKKPGMKILLVGHSYLLSDPYLGQPVIKALRNAGAVPIRADHLNRDAAVRACSRFSPTCRWIMSEELVGAVQLCRERIDGMILLSAFPCGPDSMTNELLNRRIQGIPVLNLVLDAQSGTAGMETRLESFLDIIHMKRGEEL